MEVNLLLCVTSVSADSLQCYFAQEGRQTFGFGQELPGVFVSQPSPFYPRKTHHLAYSHLGSRRLVSK